jgi:dihydroxyacetone kinase-like protein
MTKQQLITWLNEAARLLEQNKAYLTELDSAVGDADHGTNLARGFQVVVQNLPTVADQDLGAICKFVAMTLISKVGGASGLLYGNFFMKVATFCAGKKQVTASELVTLLEKGVNGIIERGRAGLGDKTMLDAWLPAIAALKNAVISNHDLPTAIQAGVTAAQQGRDSTIPLRAKKGRASYLGERSIGHLDPGAASTALLWQALHRAVQSL